MGNIVDFNEARKKFEEKGELPTSTASKPVDPEKRVVGIEDAKAELEIKKWEEKKAYILANWDSLTRSEQKEFEYENEVWEQTHRPLTLEEQLYLDKQHEDQGEPRR